MSLVEAIREQLQHMPSSRRGTMKQGNFWMCCPYHSNGNERTPSFKINLSNSDIPIGHGWCFSCGANKSWNDIAKDFNLKQFKSSDNYEENTSGIFSNEDEENLLGVSKNKSLDSIPWPKDQEWRGISGKLINKLGGLMFYSPIVKDTQLYLPVNVMEENMGGINCVLERKKGQKGYFNTPDLKSLKSLFPYDYISKHNDGIVAMCEGPRDALNLIQYGIPAVSIIGTGTVKGKGRGAENKANLILALDPKLVLLMFDADEAGKLAEEAMLEKLKYKVNVKAIHLKSGNDPANLSKKQVAKVYEYALSLLNKHAA